MDGRSLALGVVAILLVGCSGGAPSAITSAVPTSASTSAAPSTPPTPSPSSSARPAATSIVVTLGTQRISVRCKGAGNGRPTILLMHGNGGGGEGQFRLLEEHLLTLSRVCEYDRPGTGHSPAPAELPRLITAVVAEARAVVVEADIGARVFLLGTSEGGAIAFLYAQAYADEVAGFVSINPNPPYEQWLVEARKVETPEEIATAEEPDYRGENPEQIDNRSNSSMLTTPLPDSMPYAIMFDEDCGGDTTFCDKVFEPLRAITERLAKVGSGGRFVPVPGAGHSIQQSNPSEIIRVVDEVWAEAND